MCLDVHMSLALRNASSSVPVMSYDGFMWMQEEIDFEESFGFAAQDIVGPTALTPQV